MTQSKNKGLVFIIISLVILSPNIGCLLVAHFVLTPPPVILYIVPSVMIILAVLGLIYGVTLRKKQS